MQFSITNAALAILAVMPVVQAHMAMTDPAPIRHPKNPNSQNKDFDYTKPLGSPAEFPCKGYLSAGAAELKSVATWAAGSSQSFTISGGAAHGGGSCQASISEDGGKTFKVIKSFIGNCPVNGDTKFPIEVPAATKAGDAIFAWSWFNKIGNREMYMNCAAVTITGGGSGLSALPDIVVGNTANAGCSFAEGVDPEFPNPGANVVRAPGAKTAPGTGNCGAAAAPGSGTPVSPPVDSKPSATSTPVSSPSATKPAVGNPAPTPSAGTPTSTSPAVVAPSSTKPAAAPSSIFYDPSTNPGIPSNNLNKGGNGAPAAPAPAAPAPAPVAPGKTVYYDPTTNPGIPSNNVKGSQRRAIRFRA